MIGFIVDRIKWWFNHYSLLELPNSQEVHTPATVITRCIACQSTCTQTTDDLKNFRTLPHCNWCLTPIGMDGKFKSTYSNTMEIEEVIIHGESFKGDRVDEAFSGAGAYRTDRSAHMQWTKAVLRSEGCDIPYP